MAVEVYATTLHYAPCHTNAAEGFCTAVVLPRGTNTEKPSVVQRGGEDALLWARNKWLLAHAASDEAAQGAYVGLAGENIDISGQPVSWPDNRKGEMEMFANIPEVKSWASLR